MTTPLFLLRCCEVGISIRDLDLLTIGVVLDMWTEKSNDGVKYRRLADQADFDKFLIGVKCCNLAFSDVIRIAKTSNKDI